jgi:hypothetical protein
MTTSLRIAGVVVLALAGVAAADPPARQSCRELPTATYRRLPPEAQRKLAATQRFEKGRNWHQMVVTVVIARAPHIARTVLAECPGVVAIDTVEAIDRRRFMSQVTMHVTSYAAVARIGQLPAVDHVRMSDPDEEMRRARSMPDFDFELE